jgi:putative oxidoreductase
MRVLFLLGRAIFGGFFVWNGLNHWREQESMSQYAASKGVAAADVAVPASGTLILAGGASVLAGVQPRLGLAAIIAFLIPVSLQMHRFWDVDDPAQRMNELINFSKNMALLGAAFMLLQLDEPWPASVDALRGEEEEMFVRLGGRDLRALPA